MTEAKTGKPATELAKLASDQFTGSIDPAAVARALQRAEAAGQEAQDYMLSRVKPESKIRYR
ncbi:MAG: hypothetical protein R3B40_24500 [Polyangiales bacterium]|nr:hypothetical protein [Myxococcales bacterium]MCB9659543.1 hypothetical protein [Sandaracinaceae bacterium]